VRNRARTLSLSALALIVASYVAVVLPPARTVGPDIAALMISKPDEMEIARGIHGMITERTLRYQIPAYGGAYPLLAYLASKPSLLISGYSEQNLVLALRTFSVVFGALAIIAIFWLVYVVVGSWFGATVAAAMMPLIPEMIMWSARIHPDTLLWFELSLALGAMTLALRHRSQKYLTAALIIAAIATMTKLVGLYLLPVILFIQFRNDYLSDSPRRARLFLLHLFWGVVLFLFVCYVTTPTLLVESGRFVHGVRTTTREIAAGPQTDRIPTLSWLEVLVDPRMAGLVLGAIFLIYGFSFLPWFARLVRSPRSALEELGSPAYAAWPIMVFAGGYLFHLLIGIRDYHSRYLAPIFPALAVTAGATVALGWAHLPLRWREWFAAKPRWVRVLPIVVLIGGFSAELKARTASISGELKYVRSIATDPRLEMGRWLEENVDPDATIIYDYHIYVPLKFKNASVTFGLFEGQVHEHNPDYVLIHDGRRELFKDPSTIHGTDRDAWYHKERVRTLALLEEDKLLTLRKLKRLDHLGITIYHNVAAAH
jgi:hypothetical protein